MRRARPPHPRALRIAVVTALLAVAVVIAQAAQARTAANLVLDVQFSTNGTIAVTLPDGTPVGVTSGSPTTISAGYYNVVELGPGGCTAMPHFTLKGPGVSIFDNLLEGESTTITFFEYLDPNSTYTWGNDAFPGVIHTFVTSSTIGGTPPPNLPKGLSSSDHTTVSSSSLVGSNLAPFRGTLTGAVSATGTLTLELKGKSVSSLQAGRYKISVTDKSKTSGFMLQKNASGMVTVTGVSFVGRHSQTVHLTAGTWSLMSRPGSKVGSISVS